MNTTTSTLSGKTALITGGARGIGRATALKLANAGCDIAVNYYNSSDEAEALCQQLQAMGRKAVAIQASVADQRSVKEMIKQLEQDFSAVDILVSNAASGVLKPAMEMNVKHWRWCMETNALALNHVVQETRHLMKPGSRVLAISSLGASRAIPNYAFIGASKAALESLVRSLSLELASEGITVNTVSAGVVDTDALKHFPNREQLLDNFHTRSLSERSLLASDIADAIYLLCLPEAAMIKGQTLFVDAGYATIG